MTKFFSLLIFILIIVFSCKKETRKIANTTNILEKIVDSTSFSNDGSYKLEILQEKGDSKIYVQIYLFKNLNNKKWNLIQHLTLIKHNNFGLDVQFKDFNNDGVNDFTYRSDISARGANDLRKLFLFDKEQEKLIEIKNSNKYPNLMYNENYNCLTSWMLYGGSSTVFLNIQNDSLIEFAGVNVFDGYKESYEILNGKRNVIQKVKYSNADEIYTRYSDYKNFEIEAFHP